MNDTERFDAIVIGAGISGLVCGCYLAKAGLRTLLAEQHHAVGGYCSSFTRKGLVFDSAAHSFGSYRDKGIIRRIFRDLGIESRASVIRSDPTDIVVMPDARLTFHADPAETAESAKRAFPASSREIDAFFGLLSSPEPHAFVRYRKASFASLLDSLLSDRTLKAMLSFPVYGNTGVPPSRLSAVLGIQIFTEFLLDGGYRLQGGMQAFASLLAGRFREFGGTLRLSSAVTGISSDGDAVNGVHVNDGPLMPAKVVVSCMDARHTALSLLRRASSDSSPAADIASLKPSLSMLILYLGLSARPSGFPGGANIWYLPDKDLDLISDTAHRADYRSLHAYMLHLSSGGQTAVAFQNISWQGSEFWKQHKQTAADGLLLRIENDLIPGFSSTVTFREAASPSTLQRYTGNYCGAAYGWEGSTGQFLQTGVPVHTSLRGIFFAGHWTSRGCGIPGVAYTGREAASRVLRTMRLVS